MFVHHGCTNSCVRALRATFPKGVCVPPSPAIALVLPSSTIFAVCSLMSNFYPFRYTTREARRIGLGKSEPAPAGNDLDVSPIAPVGCFCQVNKKERIVGLLLDFRLLF